MNRNYLANYISCIYNHQSNQLLILSGKEINMIKNILVTLCVLGLTACGSSKSDSDKQLEKENEELALNACIEKGVKYYTDLGSYPTLSTGESADLKIREKCDFNINIFN